MEGVSENQASACICRLPPALLKNCEVAYVPQIVCIGPYHRNHVQLLQMEDIKGDAKWLREKKRNLAGDFWERMIIRFHTEHCQYSFRCYEANAFHDPYWEAPRMMINDACFILEFFRCLFDEFVEDSEHVESFGANFNPVMRSEIMKDLIKLKNQIPLFVLEYVLAYVEMEGDFQKAKSSLQRLLKAVFNKFYYRPFDYVDASADFSRCKHVLDAYYHYCLGDEKEPRGGKQKEKEPRGEKQKEKDLWTWLEKSMEKSIEDLEKQAEREKVPSAAQLQKAGVEIKAIDGRRLRNIPPVQCIRFDGQSLYIPPVELDSNSEVFIRNLVALEMCYPYGSLRRMTGFGRFINELCQTEEGATVMRQNGVIVGNLWQPSQVAQFFSSTSQSHLVPACDSIEETRTELMKFYSRKYRIVAAEKWNEFKKTYFSKPWILIGGIGATVILILTAIQVFCLFHSCGASAH